MADTQNIAITASPVDTGEEPFRRHYSVKGAAVRLCMSERRIRKAVNSGELRSVMFAGRQIIPGSEVRKLAEAIT